MNRLVRHLAALALVVSASAAAEPKSSKAQVSSNGAFAIRLTELEKDKCQLEVLRNADVVWSLPRCVGTPDDLYFVSDDGERFWVLYTLPQKSTKDWWNVPVARLYERAGTVVQSRRAVDVIPSKGRSEVRQLGKHFKWLEGVLGVPGRGPRVTDKNQVELETVGTHTVRLSF
jgi:hypothetical protein